MSISELTTFGAVIKFGFWLEDTCIALYKRAITNEKLSKFKENFSTLLEAHLKRKNILDEVKREKLNEVLLEPISGLNAASYAFDHELVGEIKLSELIERTIFAEDKSSKFYLGASEMVKSFSLEVTRIFARLANDNLKNIERLRKLKNNI